jgi:hypothetical protein
MWYKSYEFYLPAKRLGQQVQIIYTKKAYLFSLHTFYLVIDKEQSMTMISKKNFQYQGCKKIIFFEKL